jgi:hypothetical protein
VTVPPEEPSLLKVIRDRSEQLSRLIERAMGKAVSEETEAVFEM